jgi:hypothetical protein
MDGSQENIRIHSFDLHNKGGPGCSSAEIHKEWDMLADAIDGTRSWEIPIDESILADVSDGYLVGRVRGWLETKKIKETRTSVALRVRGNGYSHGPKNFTRMVRDCIFGIRFSRLAE